MRHHHFKSYYRRHFTGNAVFFTAFFILLYTGLHSCLFLLPAKAACRTSVSNQTATRISTTQQVTTSSMSTTEKETLVAVPIVSESKKQYLSRISIGLNEKVRLDRDCSMNPEKYRFQSSKPSVAHVGTKGRVTGLKCGKAVITCSNANNKVLYKFHVTVKKAPKKLLLQQDKISLFTGQTTTISYRFNKASACNKVTFQSKNPSIATVNKSGLIKAKKKGSTNIKITAYNGVFATVKLTVKSADKILALTFDDGPSKTNTTRLLDALNKENCHATFFTLGYEAQNNGPLLKRMLAEGHEVGVHSWNHSNYSKLSQTEIDADITKARDTIHSVCGSYPTLMRPPYGAYNDTTLAVMKQKQLPVVLWNTDIRDWDTTDSSKVKNDLLQTCKNGAVYVLHDSHTSTVDAVISALPELKAKGYEMVTISEYARIRKMELSNGKVFTGKK